ncbi:MAG: YidC/Oxa1 family membrane protein insertase [Oscillospiraceae bacterium]|nr:YidC/Oxa1 family membrane protein insertase [Oscillospiraceae bacterium]
MILANGLLGNLIKVPFGYLLDWLYQFTTNYGLSLILFAIIIKLVLLPASIKSKKSTMKMSRISPRVQALQEKYAGDQQKQNEAIQALYKEEGVSMGGGCLWSFLPLFILFPLYAVVRQPITYMLHETLEVAAQVVAAIKEAAPEAFASGKNEFYHEMIAAPLIPQFAEELKGIVANPRTLEGLNFNFLGINLGLVPNWKIWQWETYDWATIGGFLLPLASTGIQFVSMFISQKQNNSVITNEKGLQDEEMAKKSQQNQSTQTMLYMMPLMTLWIGFTVPGALSIYWLIQGVASTVQDVILTKHFRKVYDEEDAIRQARAAEEEKLLAEKERIRAERRAANPDGITENTSKKKLQKKLQNEQEAAKAAAKREYEAKKGIVVEEAPKKEAMSGIADRPYCKGRNYDPNRYSNTEE